MLFTDLKSSFQVMIYRRFKIQAFYRHAGYPKTFCTQCMFIKAWANTWEIACLGRFSSVESIPLHTAVLTQ